MKSLLTKTLIAAAGIVTALSMPTATRDAWAQAAPTTAAAPDHAAVATATTGAGADAIDIQALRSAVKADKKAYIASMLKLTSKQEKRFWPLYDAYQGALNLANQERAVTLNGMLSRDEPMTNAYAKQVAAAGLTADETEIRARRRLYARLMRALPAEKAARYLQLENKIRAAQNYDLAATIPLIH
jgi:Spy/CpxP family protein refolding chaperone